MSSSASSGYPDSVESLSVRWGDFREDGEEGGEDRSVTGSSCICCSCVLLCGGRRGSSCSGSAGEDDAGSVASDQLSDGGSSVDSGTQQNGGCACGRCSRHHYHYHQQQTPRLKKSDKNQSHRSRRKRKAAPPCVWMQRGEGEGEREVRGGKRRRALGDGESRPQQNQQKWQEAAIAPDSFRYSHTAAAPKLQLDDTGAGVVCNCAPVDRRTHAVCTGTCVGSAAGEDTCKSPVREHLMSNNGVLAIALTPLVVLENVSSLERWSLFQRLICIQSVASETVVIREVSLREVVL